MFPIPRREAFSENAFHRAVGAPDVAAAAQPEPFVIRHRHGGVENPLASVNGAGRGPTQTPLTAAVPQQVKGALIKIIGDEAFDVLFESGKALRHASGSAVRAMALGAGA